MTDKKKSDEKLQELRHKNHDNIKYRKRKQLEQEEAHYMKEELKRIGKREV